MNMAEEIKCYHCNKLFYLKSFRFRVAKTVSCLYCGKQIIKQKVKELENAKLD